MSRNHWTDYSIVPLYMVGSVALASFLLAQGIPDLLVTPLVVGPLVAITAFLEWQRPAREDCLGMDQSIFIEAAHFFLSFEFGYGLSLAACELLRYGAHWALPTPLWPTDWPIGFQVFLAILFYEGTSYWQHRLLHQFPRLWRFHALHHSGARVNMWRVVRFHFVDIGTAAFVAYVPLVILATPEPIITRMVALLSAMSLLQHANIRMRTPVWLDTLICTPIVHRHHHSQDLIEGNRNFGNTVMLFDQLFGTYGQHHPEGPVRMGIKDDPVPKGFWPQWISPFKA